MPNEITCVVDLVFVPVRLFVRRILAIVTAKQSISTCNSRHQHHVDMGAAHCVNTADANSGTEVTDSKGICCATDIDVCDVG